MKSASKVVDGRAAMKLLRCCLMFLSFTFSVHSANAVLIGDPTDPLFGCDPDMGFFCTITLDEAGNISAVTNSIFGNIIQVSHIASTVNPGFVDSAGNPLEVTSYLVGLSLFPGTIGLCEIGLNADGSCIGGVLGDLLIFTTLVDAPGMAGLSRIDFLSDTETPTVFAADFNILEAGPEGNNGAIYSPDCSPRCEQITYIIRSDTPVPEPSSLTLLASALVLLGAGVRRRRPMF